MSERWKTVFAFLSGAVLANLAADPTDVLFFQRVSEGTPLSSSEQAWLWYLLPSLFYGALFFAAYLASRTGFLQPVHIIYVLMGLVVFGTVRSLSFGSPGSLFTATVLSAGAISLGILWGVRRRVDSQ